MVKCDLEEGKSRICDKQEDEEEGEEEEEEEERGEADTRR